MSNITAPSNAESISFEPSRDRQDMADIVADQLADDRLPDEVACGCH